MNRWIRKGHFFQRTWYITKSIIGTAILMSVLSVRCTEQIEISPANLDEVDQIIDAYVELGNFSGTVMIAKDGKPIYERVVGHADRSTRTLNSMETAFHIGSIIKIFTQILVLQQVEDGQLSLDDTLGKYLSGFPKAVSESVRIKYLLDHTAGFGDIFIPAYMRYVRDFKTIEDKLALLRNEPLLSQPGQEQRYSNYGYIVLGAILEKVSGQSFKQLLNEHIFEPLGMKNGHFDLAERLAHAARSYRFNPDGEVVDHTTLLEYPSPDGGVYSTCGDLLAFAQAFFYSDKLLSDASKAKIISNYRDTGNSDWQRFLNSSNSFVHEAGGGPGVSASILQMVKQNCTVIVLSNYDQSIAESVGLRIADLLRGNDYPPPRLPRAHVIYRSAKAKGWDQVLAHREEILQQAGYQNGRIRYSDLNTLGYELLWANDLERAKEVFEANIRLFPDMPNGYDSMAEACWWSDEVQKAEVFYRKALSIDPDYGYSKMMLEKLYTEHPELRED